MSKKRRYLGKLIADLQSESRDPVYQVLPANDVSEKQKKTLQIQVVQIDRGLSARYEFFLVGEINLELQLDVEEDYFPIGRAQSPLTKWRPFVRASTFWNRLEMTIDASYPGISEFEFLVLKLLSCSSEIYKQLGIYLQGYQKFVRKIKSKMLSNPVPQRLYSFKFENFLQASSTFIDSLPVNEFYAVSIMQLDYTICTTKRVKFVVSKALSELVGGVDLSEAANLLLRKGWMEIFSGAQRIMKNIMLLNRLMKEGQQLLAFKIYTVDKIIIEVSAEIEIVQSLRNYVDVGFVEMIKFSISSQQIAYVNAVRYLAKQLLQETNPQLFFESKTVDLLPHSARLQLLEKLDIISPITNSPQRFRHPNFFLHDTDRQYQKSSETFLNQFYQPNEIQRMKMNSDPLGDSVLFVGISTNEKSEQNLINLELDEEHVEKGELLKQPWPTPAYPFSQSANNLLSAEHNYNIFNSVVGRVNEVVVTTFDSSFKSEDFDVTKQHQPFSTQTIIQASTSQSKLFPVLPPNLFLNRPEFHSVEVLAELIKHEREIIQEIQCDIEHNSEREEMAKRNIDEATCQFQFEQLEEENNIENRIIDDQQEVLIPFDNDDEAGYQNISFFNLFDDESLNCTAIDLNRKQRKLQKLFYFGFHDKFE